MQYLQVFSHVRVSHNKIRTVHNKYHKVEPDKKVAPAKKSRASKKKESRQRKKVVPKVRKCSPEWKKGYISSMKLYARVYDTNRAPYICYLDRENERELCSFCKFSDIIIRRPNRSEKIVIFEGEMNVHM